MHLRQSWTFFTHALIDDPPWCLTTGTHTNGASVCRTEFGGNTWECRNFKSKSFYYALGWLSAAEPFESVKFCIFSYRNHNTTYLVHYSLWLSANVRNFSCRKSLRWLIYINSVDKTNYIVIPSSKMFNLKFHECLWDVMELFDFPIHFRQIWYKWPRRCVVFLWFSCGCPDSFAENPSTGQ